MRWDNTLLVCRKLGSNHCRDEKRTERIALIVVNMLFMSISVATIAAMKSGLKAATRLLIALTPPVATIAAMKSGLKVLLPVPVVSSLIM